MKKQKSDEAQVAFIRKRQALDIKIEEHQETGERYLSPMVGENVHPPNDNIDDGWTDNEWKDIADDGMEIPDAPFTFSFGLGTIPTEIAPDTEKKPVFLPSTIGYERCVKLGLQALVTKEIALREGQANDSLQAIRLAIGEKSFRFRKQLRFATSKKKKTRSWDGIHIVGKRIQHHRLVYRQARYALKRLGVDKDKLDCQFRELMDDDLQTSTAVMEPNARGQRKKQLSWIWQTPGMNITNQTTVVNECECCGYDCLSPMNYKFLSKCIGSIGFVRDRVVIDGRKRSHSLVMKWCGLCCGSKHRLSCGDKGPTLKQNHRVSLHMHIVRHQCGTN